MEAPPTIDINQYKLDTTFYEGYLIHKVPAENEDLPQLEETWKEVEMIGEGGFGSVWLEKRELTGELRAVKRIFREKSRNFSFSRELHALIQASDDKDLFVQFLCWYEDKNFIFVAMEYLENGDLAEYLKEHRSKARSEVEEITEQLLRGLAVLHGKKICHRDLKPKNILISCFSPIEVKLADFGTSKSTIDTTLRTRCGTSGYMAPELHGFWPPRKARGTYSTALDMWSLGCVIYEIWTSEIPFMLKSADTTSSTMGEIPAHDMREIDMGLLSQFCWGNISFPIECLRESWISGREMDFLGKLLVADPASRITAIDALRSRLLFDFVGEPLDYENSLNILRDQSRLLGLEFDAQSFECLALERKDQRFNITIFKGLGEMDFRRLFLKTAEHGYTLFFKFLLKIAGSPHDMDDCLVIAARYGHPEIVRLLLSKRILEGRREGLHWSLRSVLGQAIVSGQIEVVRELLGSGVDVNSKTSLGRTALHEAAERGNLELVELLLDNGADIDANTDEIHGWPCGTALHQAAEGGHVEVARLLLSRGANANAVSNLGQTAFHQAVKAENLELIGLLLDSGANINGDLSETAFHKKLKTENLHPIRLLVEGGANEELYLSYGAALHQAVRKGNLEMIRLLLDKGASINGGVASPNRTPLHEAVEIGNLEVVRLLLDRGGGANFREGLGDTIYEAVLRGENLEVAELLIERGLIDDLRIIM